MGTSIPELKDWRLSPAKNGSVIRYCCTHPNPVYREGDNDGQSERDRVVKATSRAHPISAKREGENGRHSVYASERES